MIKRLVVAMIIAATTIVVHAQYYISDILGEGYEQHTFVMPSDYHGEVFSTLVRKQATDSTHRAVLYVHGYNDYFFQEEMASRWVDEGYNFYAIDLRKYGRSLREGQWEYEVRDMSEYFADIDSALSVIEREGNDQIVLMGHSTGGLTTSLYCESKGENLVVDALILNSPFFEWNYSALFRNVLIPAVSFLGKYFPDWGLPDATKNSNYGMSLLAEYYGEWTFDTKLKRLQSRGERFGWIRAIDEGHKIIHRGLNVSCPILLMHSDKSIRGNEWTPAFLTGDAVLDVDHIAHYGRNLGSDVTDVTIEDGLHDLFLSRKEVREEAYRNVFDWLKKKLNNHGQDK